MNIKLRPLGSEVGGSKGRSISITGGKTLHQNDEKLRSTGNPDRLISLEDNAPRDLGQKESSRSSIEQEGSDDDQDVGRARGPRKPSSAWRRALNVTYFIGIMRSFGNRVKLYGAIRRYDHINEVYKQTGTTYERKKCLFYPEDRLRIGWNFIMFFALLITGFVTPLKICFVTDNSPIGWRMYDFLMDSFFIIDLIMTFLSPYYDNRNRIVDSHSVIAKGYLKSWFILDLVAALPLSEILPSDSQSQRFNTLLRLIRLPRLVTILRVLKIMRINQNMAAKQIRYNKILALLKLNMGVAQLVKVFLTVLFLNHIVACLWFYTAQLNDFDPSTWVVVNKLLDEDIFTQYIASYYWALQTLTTVGYGDLPAGTTAERTLAIFWMIFGVGFYSFTIGNIASILANLDKRASMLKLKIDSFNDFAIKVKLPNELRQKIVRYFELNHRENIYSWIDPNNIIGELPSNLRRELLYSAFYRFIENIPLFQRDANFTALIIPHMKVLKLNTREILYREEDPAEEIYFIHKGRIYFVTEDNCPFISIIEGSYFGEIEILENTKRWCFAQSKGETILLVLHKSHFLQYLREFPELEEDVKRFADERKKKFLMCKEIQMKEAKPGKEGAKKKLLKSTEYYERMMLAYIGIEDEVLNAIDEIKDESPEIRPPKAKIDIAGDDNRRKVTEKDDDFSSYVIKQTKGDKKEMTPPPDEPEPEMRVRPLQVQPIEVESKPRQTPSAEGERSTEDRGRSAGRMEMKPPILEEETKPMSPTVVDADLVQKMEAATSKAKHLQSLEEEIDRSVLEMERAKANLIDDLQQIHSKQEELESRLKQVLNVIEKKAD
eukprot:TRINITY_DN2328_c0_g2_i4.p1 TRINITY_DN2328_c0_g2~~TRINITY_DN2328_c0_g2_i4.p1  ORF type:complete len:833 (+),score=237.86 TRINITY_DN2328_c0_g2_i4:185-2683(+)